MVVLADGVSHDCSRVYLECPNGRSWGKIGHFLLKCPILSE